MKMTNKEKCEAYDKLMQFLKMRYADYCGDGLESDSIEVIIEYVMEEMYEEHLIRR